MTISDSPVQLNAIKPTLGETSTNTHREARTHDHKVKGLALCRQSWEACEIESVSMHPKLVPSLHRNTAETLQRLHLHLAVLPLAPG